MKDDIDELDTEDTGEEIATYNDEGEVVETAKRGRPKGFTKDIGYIMIDKKLRVRVEADNRNLILEHLISEDNWGNNQYLTSWNSVFNCLIWRCTTEKISKSGMINIVQAKKEILAAIDEVKELFFGDINRNIEMATDEIKKAIQTFNK